MCKMQLPKNYTNTSNRTKAEQCKPWSTNGAFLSICDDITTAGDGKKPENDVAA